LLIWNVYIGHDEGMAATPLPSNVANERVNSTRASERLLTQLFEQMWGLEFLPTVAEGADYVQDLLHEYYPDCYVLVHLFDINTKQFVVVRAAGSAEWNVDPHRLLMTSIDAQDPVLAPTLQHGRVREGAHTRFSALTERAYAALFGPIAHEGRYLGVLELISAKGAPDFSKSDKSGLEYVCSKFGEFLAKRPVVLEPDAVLKPDLAEAALTTDRSHPYAVFTPPRR
jgi:hypothetical protein